MKYEIFDEQKFDFVAALVFTQMFTIWGHVTRSELLISRNIYFILLHFIPRYAKLLLFTVLFDF